MLIGLVAGTYSSIFIAAPFWVSLKKEDKVTKQNTTPLIYPRQYSQIKKKEI